MESKCYSMDLAGKKLTLEFGRYCEQANGSVWVHMGDTVVDLWMEDAPKMEVNNKQGKPVTVDAVDLLATTFSEKAGMAVAAVNKHPDEAQLIRIPLKEPAHVTLYTLNGESKDSYNDVDREDVTIRTRSLGLCGECLEVVLEPHSVNIIEIG